MDGASSITIRRSSGRYTSLLLLITVHPFDTVRIVDAFTGQPFD